MKGLHLAEHLTVPPDVITQTVGILAARGAGKSNAAAVLAEALWDHGLPFVVVDPVGAWHGLRSSADGKGPGLPVPILGGEHGDVPLEAAGGPLVADFLVGEHVSCVLDVSSFSEGDKLRFLVDCIGQLYRKNRAPLHVILEEADDVAPQRPMREQARSLRAFQDLVKRGRFHGLGITMISQRSAALNKDLLTQIGTLIALRTTSPQDIKAIGEWVKYHAQSADILHSLASLEDGEAWVWSPQWLRKVARVRFPRRRTFDSGATPKLGAARRPVTVADVDLGALHTRMADAVERHRQNDPAELRREVSRLKAELARAQKTVPAAPSPKVREVPILKEGQVSRLEKLGAKVDATAALFMDAAGKLHAGGAALRAALITANAASRGPESPSPGPRAPRPTARAQRSRPSADAESRVVSTNGDGPGDLTGPERRILDALAWLESIGITEPEQPGVAFLAGYTVGGGAWNNPRGSLHTKGLIRYRPDGRLALTEDGRARAQAPETPLTAEALQGHVLDRLPGPEQRILRALLAVYPEAVDNDTLARQAGYEPNGGAFNNPRGRLRTLGLIEYPERGKVVARSLLFLDG